MSGGGGEGEVDAEVQNERWMLRCRGRREGRDRL